VFGNLVAGSRTLRAAAALTIIAVLSAVWVVHRTIQRSQASNERVAHTQEVLTAIESVLATIVDADTAVHRSVPLVRDRTALGQTERAVERDIGRLATLTLDSPNQQARVAQLRQDAAAVLAALRTVVETTQGARPIIPADAEAQQAGMDSARRTLQAMRVEENRLLADRVQVDQAAVRRLQFVSVTLAVAASGFLASIFWLVARNTRRQRQGADTLRQATRTWKRKWTRVPRICATRMRGCNRSSIPRSMASSSSMTTDESTRSTAVRSGYSATRNPRWWVVTSRC
jgi:CHASE3 domain sensor protein